LKKIIHQAHQKNYGNVDVENGQNSQPIDKVTLNDEEPMENHYEAIK